MIVITDKPAWIVEGDCPKCSKHDRTGVPGGLVAGQEVGMRCSECKEVYNVKIPPQPSPTLTINPKL